MSRILIIEDEAILASALATACESTGHSVTKAASASKGLDQIVSETFDLIVLDIGLPDRSGLEVLGDIQDDDNPPAVLVITAHGNLDNALAARQLGADEYLVKPFAVQHFLGTVDRLLETAQPVESPTEEEKPISFIGGSPAIQPVFNQIAHAIQNDLPVLISGETGTGKTLCANLIHEHSGRTEADLVTLHCGTLPDNLLEVELFGHERAAFSGANSVKRGHLERAHGGTLFLDEIGSLPLAVQAKLLRFLEDKTLVRIGGRDDITIDCRILAATRRPVRELVAEGTFREDLYYRLRVLEVEIPPLRNRKEDIPALVDHFLDGSNRHLDESVLPILTQYPWPGNVRELRNVLQRAAAISSGSRILKEDLPPSVLGESVDPMEELVQSIDAYLDHAVLQGWDWQKIHDRIEDELLKNLLARFGGKSSTLARELGMNRSTLLKKRKRFESPDDNVEDSNPQDEPAP